MWTSGFMRTLSCVYAPVKSGCVNRMWVPAAGPARTMEENKEPAYKGLLLFLAKAVGFSKQFGVCCYVNPLRG